jgi:transglutaminase-like putative cysteine protease
MTTLLGKDLALQMKVQMAPKQASAPQVVEVPGIPGRVNDLLASMREELKQNAAKGQIRSALRADEGNGHAKHAKAFLSAASELRQYFGDVERFFKDQEKALKDANASQLLTRHGATVAAFQQRRQEYERLVAALEAATDGSIEQAAALDTLDKLFDQYPSTRAHQPTNPGRLPFRIQDQKARDVYLGSAQFEEHLFPPKYNKMLLASLDMQGLQLTKAALPQVPDAGDLSPTEDAQITAAVRELANQLHNNPVEIYQWVRNNIGFMPTYGSIQGSDQTMRNQKGNAFDTASLLIALYRAAGIPARYVYGTIEVPTAQVMNWVGDVGTPQAAQALLGQGGIPNTALVAGGAIQAFRMEHVWVEAYVDFTPSRGARNLKPNTWVALDPSFKQFDWSEKVNGAVAAGFDKAALEQAILGGASVSADGNHIAGANLRAMPARLEDLQSTLSRWGASTGNAAAMAKLKHAGTVRKENHGVLLGSLPYKMLYKASTFREIPASLRWSVTVGYYGSEMDVAYESPLFERTVSLASVGGKKLAMTFAPATAADAATLDTLKNQGASSLPAYSLQVVPKLKLDDTEIAAGPAGQMGSARIVSVSISSPLQSGQADTYQIALGDETVFVLDAAGILQKTIDDRFAQYASNTASENLHTVGMLFWMLSDTANEVLGAQQGVHQVRLPSIGAFAAPLTVRYMFGIPMSGSYIGRHMDVKRVVLAATDETGNLPAQFMRASGMLTSNFEGLAFDLAFKRDIGSGGSAVRLIAQAADAGGTVYKITESNIADLSGLPLSSDVKADIENAVYAGKEALVVDTSVSNGRWQGVGYVLTDPVTGAGAYLIDGGFNGGTDNANCDAQPATAPATQPVEKPSMSFAELFAIAVVAILAAAFVIAFAVEIAIGGALLLTATAASAAPGPLGPLSSGAQEVWDLTFGRAYGSFPGGSSNFPGENLNPPGDCSQAQHDQLADEKDDLCGKPSRCRGNDCNVAEIQQKIDNRNACISKRLEIMFTCFRGGDQEHWGQVAQQLNGAATCKGCLAKAMIGQCQK